MVFQIEGGPDLEIVSPAPVSASPNLWTWDVSTSVSYQLRRSDLSLSYFHGPTQGSGVYSGAASHVFNGGYTRRLTRFFSANLNAGYTLNRALVPATTFSSQYSNWYAGANLNRQFGSSMILTIYYGAQQQISNGACPVANCSFPGTLQTLGISFAWHPRPIAVD